ncbi:hypothetical protein LEP1GSC116_3184 [Leptospira interrogans serovar Icterohaemorrhagiae str. Verdun HP]|uniref:Uncharacterized protein n=1 Tax=Leptospira interrogans serovar Icterohaemorrhagiae str. Verdun HP TaxID=1049910 RepID=M6S289_LEPIR|nr:hypothetical protein LEP1GSC116_3184 [Leptospira interrogans serovar Icterohaemorrhagiae str. Verdun HP]
MAISFDECFQTYPELHSPSDLEEFWSEAIRDLKNFPIKNNLRHFSKVRLLRKLSMIFPFNLGKMQSLQEPWSSLEKEGIFQ